MSEHPWPEPGPLGELRFASTPPPVPRWRRLLVPAGLIAAIVVGIVLLTVFRDQIFFTTGDVAHPATISGLHEGECFDHDFPMKQRDDENLVMSLSCASPHDAEVFGTAKLPMDDGFPDSEVLSTAAREGCRGLLRATDLRDAPKGVDVGMYYSEFPGRYERTVVCTFESKSGKLNRPIRQIA